MEISIKKTEKDFAFIADNGETTIPICAGEKLEKGNIGFRPMQTFLVSLASCMAIDILMILKKQRQVVNDYEVKVTGTRVDEIPSVFSEIRMDIYLKGDIKEEKVKKAIKLSEEKYCSVTHMMDSKIDVVINHHIS
jgi:putative redox protein